MGKFLEQLGSAARLDGGAAVNDEVLPQARRLDLTALERDRHPGVAGDVLELALRRHQMGGEQVRSFDANPHAGDLRRAVGAEGDEVAQRAGADQVLGAFRQLDRHGATVPIPVAANARLGHQCADTFRDMARSRHWLLALAVVSAVLLTPATGTAAQSNPAAQRLAETYAPIAMLREQKDPPCDPLEEQYQPTSVETVLGNPGVTLDRDTPGKGLAPVTEAPDASDIAGLNANHYLDLPGDPLGETCVYAKDFAEIVQQGGAPEIVYAHIARERGHTGFVLQYWFFWYFNQFNDLHEGDWEGMQLSFDAATPEEALARRQEPSEIILFQHAGGERADWDDQKVQKEGTRPVVYPAAGSHATFYDSTVYVENGQHGSGVGCDNTSEPLREVDLKPVLLPDRASRQGEFKWLSYAGRWGQKEAGFNNGPTGPATKTVWREPFSWMAEQRTTSPRLPGGSVVGPQVTGLFCGAVATASDLINLNARSPLALILTLAVIGIAIGLFVGFTRWRPIDLEHLRAQRAFGQLIRAARQLYGRHWRILVPIGVIAIPIIGGTNLLARLLSGEDAVSDVAGRSGAGLALADLVETLGRPVASAIVAGIVIVFARELSESRSAGFRSAFAGMRARIWRVVFARVLATVGVILLALTVIGIPFAIWKLVGWAFVQQEVLFTDKSLRESFRSSSDLVRGRWWRAARAIIFFNVLATIAGPVLTFALIFTPLDLIWIDLLGSLIFALLIPYTALGTTLLYFDLEARASSEPAKPRRSWRLWRPRQFGRVVVAQPADAS